MHAAADLKALVFDCDGQPSACSCCYIFSSCPLILLLIDSRETLVSLCMNGTMFRP